VQCVFQGKSESLYSQISQWQADGLSFSINLLSCETEYDVRIQQDLHRTGSSLQKEWPDFYHWGRQHGSNYADVAGLRGDDYHATRDMNETRVAVAICHITNGGIRNLMDHGLAHLRHRRTVILLPSTIVRVKSLDLLSRSINMTTIKRADQVKGIPCSGGTMTGESVEVLQ
jgi:hypothetical protein